MPNTVTSSTPVDDRRAAAEQLDVAVLLDADEVAGDDVTLAVDVDEVRRGRGLVLVVDLRHPAGEGAEQQGVDDGGEGGAVHIGREGERGEVRIEVHGVVICRLEDGPNDRPTMAGRSSSGVVRTASVFEVMRQLLGHHRPGE
jgi:hypothetical protein